MAVWVLYVSMEHTNATTDATLTESLSAVDNTDDSIDGAAKGGCLMAGARYQIQTGGRIVQTQDTDLAAEASRRGDTVTAVTEADA